MSSGVNTGFGAFGTSCGVYDNTFRNNVAHSIDGMGAMIYPNKLDSGQNACYEISYFTAYKVTESGVASYFSSSHIKASHLTLIDNGINLAVLIGTNADPAKITVDGIKIYGKSPIPDASCQSKLGILLSYVTTGGKKIFTSKTDIPLWKIKADAPFGSPEI